MQDDVTDRMREAHTLRLLRIKQFAAQLWATFDTNEKGFVRFGMFPDGKMRAAEKALAAEFELCGQNSRESSELGKDLCVALMDCASKDGGMRA